MINESIIDKLNSIGYISSILMPEEIKHLQSLDEDKKIFEDIYQKIIETSGCPLLKENTK